MKRFGLPRRERLTHTTEYVSICKKGEKYVDTLFYLYVLPNQKLYNRIGIRISKKFGKAYKRNRVKRIIKEAYRINKDMLNGFDLVFIPRHGKDHTFYNWEKKSKNILLKIKEEKDNTK